MSSRVCPRGWNGISQKARPREKNNQAVHTVAQMLTGSGARGLGAGLSPLVGVERRSRLLEAVQSA